MMIICPICGMVINSKNYSFNQDAFTAKNSENNIAYCPFCGVKIEKFNEIENLKSNEIELSAADLDILDHAMKLETFNGDFYKEASVIAKDENLRLTFKSLSRIENVHAKVHQGLGQFLELPVLRQLDYSKLVNDQMLLHEAFLREKHAVEFYNRGILKLNSDKLKIIFKTLTEVEKEHIVLVSR